MVVVVGDRGGVVICGLGGNGTVLFRSFFGSESLWSGVVLGWTLGQAEGFCLDGAAEGPDGRGGGVEVGVDLGHDPVVRFAGPFVRYGV